MTLLLDKPPLDPVIKYIGESPTLYAQKIVRKRQKEGKPVYNYGLGASPFPAPAPMIAALQGHADKKEYAPAEGILPLRLQIAQKYALPNYPLTADSVIVASGLKQLLFDAQRAFGGEIVHVVPYWVSYAEQTAILDKQPTLIRTLPELDFKLTPADIEAAFSFDPQVPRLLIFNNPVNPTGISYTELELRELAKTLSKYPCWIFSDEVYLGCHYANARHTLATYMPERVIRATSLSKEFACGGWRLGFATFPEELKALREAMIAIGTSTYSCAPLPQQYAAIEALSDTPEMLDAIKKMQVVLKKAGSFCTERFRNIGLTCPEPDSAWYLLLNFEAKRKVLERKGITTSRELVNKMIEETGIVMVCGESFGLPRKKFYARASLVDYDGAAALKNPDDSTLFERMEKSIEVLANWLED